MGKPFIKLINTYNDYYFFDVNRNEIVQTSRAMYKYLDNIINENNIDIENNMEILEELRDLKNEGYLSDNRVKSIKHPYTDTYKDIIQNNITSLILQLTQDCNFLCSYCAYNPFSSNQIQRVHTHKKMTWETIQLSVDFLFKHSKYSESISIAFYGGEPLLEIELIKKTVKYANNLFEGKNIVYDMTTNASLLTDEMCKFIVDNNIKMTISIDGSKENHNKNRVFKENGLGTFDVVIDKLNLLVEKYNYNNIEINAVIDQNLCYDETEKFFEQDIFKDLNVNYSFINDLYLTNKNKFNWFFLEKFQYKIFLINLKLLNILDENKIPKLLRFYGKDIEKALKRLNIIASDVVESSPSGPCVPGLVKIFVNSDGNIFSCERVSENDNKMIIGNIFSCNFDYKNAINIINFNKKYIDSCSNCYAFYNCTLCAKSKFGVQYNEILKNCDKVRQEFSNNLFTKILFSKINKDY